MRLNDRDSIGGGRIVNSHGGIVVRFAKLPIGLWLTLTCATHRDWAIEWVASNRDMALPPGRTVVLRVVVETMMAQAYKHGDSCPCARVLP